MIVQNQILNFVLAGILLFSWVRPTFSKTTSTCFGTTKNGKLVDGVQLPRRGKNFYGYSDTAWLLGRTYVHSKVLDVLLDAYKELETSAPGKVFVYGETGWKSGGSFKPHKTHQNGLSVDLMVPIVNQEGRSIPLPCSPLNKFCYSIEFDEKGHLGDVSIDYEALAEHIYWLHKKAIAHNIGIWRVIFDPKLQPYLVGTERWPYLKKNIKFSKKRSWVRHDEHIHVDFDLKCQPLK